jgi:hypothetical protein
LDHSLDVVVEIAETHLTEDTGGSGGGGGWGRQLRIVGGEGRGRGGVRGWGGGRRASLRVELGRKGGLGILSPQIPLCSEAFQSGLMRVEATRRDFKVCEVWGGRLVA